VSAAVFFGAVALVVAGIMWVYPDTSGEVVAAEPGTTTTVASLDVASPSDVSSEEPVADAAQVILPSVVHIQTGSGLGSGVIYDSSGLIMTAAHVVEGSETVRIRFADGEQVSGTVIGTAPEVDIAVIEVDRGDLPAAIFTTDKPLSRWRLPLASLGSESTDGGLSGSRSDQLRPLMLPGVTCLRWSRPTPRSTQATSGGALVGNGQVVGVNVSIFSNPVNDGSAAVPSDIATAYANAIVSEKWTAFSARATTSTPKASRA
jgi:putative serine protease PepD